MWMQWCGSSAARCVGAADAGQSLVRPEGGTRPAEATRFAAHGIARIWLRRCLAEACSPAVRHLDCSRVARITHSLHTLPVFCTPVRPQFLLRWAAQLQTIRHEKERVRTRERALLALEQLAGATSTPVEGLPPQLRARCVRRLLPWSGGRRRVPGRARP